jgi:Tol biopolymer transport system component
MLLIAGTAAWVVRAGLGSAATEPTSVVRLAASAGVLGAPALSPDGSRVAFSWAGEGATNPELVVLPIGSQVRQVLTHDPGLEEWPVWSPDGRRIAFIRCGAGTCGIYAIAASGGPEQKLRDLAPDRYYGLAWSPDGRFLAYAERPSPARPFALFLLSIDGLTARRLTAPADGNVGDLRFAFSPDGRTLGVIRLTDNIAVHLIAVDTGADRTLLSDQREWVGGIVWSGDGQHLVLSANQQGVRRLWKVPIAGGGLQQVAAAGEDSYHPSVSAAAGRLAFVHEFRDWDLSRGALVSGQLRGAAPFLSSARADLDPAFSPDGRRVAFVSERGGMRDLWVSNSDGTAARQLATLRPDVAARPCWSPDGTRLAFHGGGIHVVAADGGTPRRMTQDGETPSWSSDAQWIYYIAVRGGRFHGLKVPAAGGTPVQVVQNEASAVHEGPNGDLYFATSRGGIWRALRGSGEEEPVIAEFDWSLPAYWTVFDDGIYYVVRESLADGSVVNRLKFYDFAHARSSDRGTLDGTLELWVGGLTLSPDRRTVVYSKLAYQTSEVMMLEHFR